MVGSGGYLALFGCLSEYGRESSPWEIEKLKSGVDAIKDIVSADMEEFSTSYEVNPRPLEFDVERHKLALLFESYAAVDEASLISIAREPGAEPSPMIGLTLSDIDEKKLETLFLEIRGTFSEERRPLVCTDARTQGSPNFGLFETATPFYIKVLESKEGK